MKNPAAVSLGKLGGKASAKKLTAKQRKERATRAVAAREAKRSQLHPREQKDMEKIVAADYKGKWFVLQDEGMEDDFGLRPEINVEYVTNAGLREHVENCQYYGIPAYIGQNKELRAKIKEIEDEIEKEETLPTH